MFLTRLPPPPPPPAAFISALWFLERPALTGVVAVIVVIAGYEWASLSKIRKAVAGLSLMAAVEGVQPLNPGYFQLERIRTEAPAV